MWGCNQVLGIRDRGVFAIVISVQIRCSIASTIDPESCRLRFSLISTANRNLIITENEWTLMADLSEQLRSVWSRHKLIGFVTCFTVSLVPLQNAFYI